MANKSKPINKSWGSRFKIANNELALQFGASISFDIQLAKYDILASIAHAQMLAKVGVLTKVEYSQIAKGLEQILGEIKSDNFKAKIELEDIHMNIEARLIEICGDVGGKLHTGRSRNDQVATDMRLYLRDSIDAIIDKLVSLQLSFVNLAKRHINTIIPGFTHLQAAQPLSFAHHLMAYVEMFDRDLARLKDCYLRTNISPLGAAALAGTSYAIDREFSAGLLDFDGICKNSVDAVSDRDFAIEFCSVASITMMHLSRFCEELILWSSVQFNFIEIADEFCSGSSIMPQKKNPDVAELIRGKTGRVYGSLITLLTLMKSQPLAYNKDNQEDKEPLFDAVNTLTACLSILAAMIPEIRVNTNITKQSAKLGFATATDLADYLVKKGIPFRQAHHIVGRVVLYCIDNQIDIADLPLPTLQKFDKRIKDDVFAVLSLQGSITSRNHIGGTAPAQVKAAIKAFEKGLSAR